MNAWEVNFDGLVGPTHNYAGLSHGNLASEQNKSSTSNPKLAAQQGLDKMKFLHDQGLIQGVLAPHERPDMDTLRRLGFTGTDADAFWEASNQAPKLLQACCSASSMWAANAATVSPSADSLNNKVHLTPANLISNFHRSIEHEMTARVLKAIFTDHRYFQHHSPLPCVDNFADEGAANHSRFCVNHSDPGVELFVYGRSGTSSSNRTSRYPARQTKEASEAIARKHLLDPDKVVYAQQNPAVIDQGVFHNDVIAVANQNLLFCHEQAFVDQTQLIEELDQKMSGNFHCIEVPTERVSVNDAVSSYLFNSQLLSLPDNSRLIIVPDECKQNASVWTYLQELISENTHVNRMEVLDLRQSMKNGGGPACLRLRVVLNETELAACNQSVMMSDDLYIQLSAWIEKHYRDKLNTKDLLDPQLVIETRIALDELTQILQLGSIYPFQR